MKHRWMPTAILSLIFAYSLSAQIIDTPMIGVGINHGGAETKAIMEYTLAGQLSKKISLNVRYGTNYSSLFKFGGGIAYTPFELGRLYPSIGFEIHYNNELFASSERRFQYHSYQIPLMINYDASDHLRFDLGIIGRTAKYGSDNPFFRLSAYYKF